MHVKTQIQSGNVTRGRASVPTVPAAGLDGGGGVLRRPSSPSFQPVRQRPVLGRVELDQPAVGVAGIDRLRSP